jgi:hypothetical protein
LDDFPRDINVAAFETCYLHGMNLKEMSLLAGLVPNTPRCGDVIVALYDMLQIYPESDLTQFEDITFFPKEIDMSKIKIEHVETFVNSLVRHVCADCRENRRCIVDGCDYRRQDELYNPEYLFACHLDMHICVNHFKLMFDGRTTVCRDGSVINVYNLAGSRIRFLVSSHEHVVDLTDKYVDGNWVKKESQMTSLRLIEASAGRFLYVSGDYFLRITDYWFDNFVKIKPCRRDCSVMGRDGVRYDLIASPPRVNGVRTSKITFSVEYDCSKVPNNTNVTLIYEQLPVKVYLQYNDEGIPIEKEP